MRKLPIKIKELPSIKEVQGLFKKKPGALKKKPMKKLNGLRDITKETEQQECENIKLKEVKFSLKKCKCKWNCKWKS